MNRGFPCPPAPFAVVACLAMLLLAPFGAMAQQGIELLTVLPASAGRADALIYVTDAKLRQQLQAGLSPGGFRVVTGQGQAHVQSFKRIADTGERVFTVLAFDASGSFAPYWQDAIRLARSFGDGMPAGRAQATRVVTFGLTLDDMGTATSRQDLDVLLGSLARRKPDQSATRLKAFVRQSVQIASDEQPVSNRGVRQVIVFTDAGEESTAYDVNSLTADALSLGVQIHVLAFYRKGHRHASLARLLDEMRQLADNTGGKSIQVDDVNQVTGPVRQLAVAPFDAAWLTIDFCGVPAGQAYFEDTLSIEAIRNGTRVAFSAPLRFRQEATGDAVATCRPCQPPCQAESSCIDGTCAAIPGGASAMAGTKQSSWWIWALVAAGAFVLVAFVAARSGRPSTPPFERALVPAPPPPSPGPEFQPEPTQNGAAEWHDPFQLLPFTRLVSVEGTFPSVLITLNKRKTVIGGDPGSVDEAIDVKQMSGRHALFELFPDGSVYVTDLGSSNGTWVDGRKLAREERCRLSPGQVVELSRKVKLRLESSGQDRGLAVAPAQTSPTPPGPGLPSDADVASEDRPRRPKAQTIYSPIGKKGDDQ